MKPILNTTLVLLCLGSAFTVHAQSNCASKTGEAALACQREEAAVRQEEKRGELQSGINYRDNALARCDPLPAADREDCVRRVQGEGTARGSVESGGIYRETRSIRIGPQPSGSAGSSSSATDATR